MSKHKKILREFLHTGRFVSMHFVPRPFDPFPGGEHAMSGSCGGARNDPSAQTQNRFFGAAFSVLSEAVPANLPDFLPVPFDAPVGPHVPSNGTMDPTHVLPSNGIIMDPMSSSSCR